MVKKREGKRKREEGNREKEEVLSLLLGLDDSTSHLFYKGFWVFTHEVLLISEISYQSSYKLKLIFLQRKCIQVGLHLSQNKLESHLV